jgi:hypothetical protein
MKLLNLALNGIVGLSAAILIAYFGLRSNEGLFTSLPDNLSGIFIQNPGLQFMALAIIVAALVAKVPVVKALKRQQVESRE